MFIAWIVELFNADRFFASGALRPRRALQDGFTRDVRKIGHFGSGDLEITIMSDQDLDQAKSQLERAYQGG